MREARTEKMKTISEGHVLAKVLAAFFFLSIILGHSRDAAVLVAPLSVAGQLSLLLSENPGAAVAKEATQEGRLGVCICLRLR